MAPDQTRPPVDAISSAFETLAPTGEADPLCRGTHQYERATVERTYHRPEPDILAAETAFLEGEETVHVLDECWLLEDGTTLAHTGQELLAFCEHHHYSEPATDIEFCLNADTETEGNAADPVVTMGNINSTFQPVSEVKVDAGAVLRYTGSHESHDARLQRAFFVDETRGELRVRTVYFWAGDRLGSVTERESLIDDGAFVETTGEPVDAYCRRTHLQEPETDLEYCAQLGTGSPPAELPDSE